MVYIYPSLTQNFALIEYHVAWLRNDTVRMTNCLQTQPHWMSERRAILGSLPMSRVFLPGTHDSASYEIYVEANSENFVERYVITQVNSKLIIKLNNCFICVNQIIYKFISLRQYWFRIRSRMTTKSLFLHQFFNWFEISFQFK